MAGAMPPIAIEAVLKLLALGQDHAKAKKVMTPSKKAKLELRLNRPSEAPRIVAPPARTARRRPPVARPGLATAIADGTESC